MSKNALRKKEREKAREILRRIEIGIQDVLKKLDREKIYGWEYGKALGLLLFESLSSPERQLIKRYSDEVERWGREILLKDIEKIKEIATKKGFQFVQLAIFLEKNLNIILSQLRKNVQNWRV